MKKIKKIENNIIKDIRNLFSLKKEINDTTVKYITNLFRRIKENKEVKNRLIGDIRNLLDWKKKLKQVKME